ncbi:MAG TPA: flagellar hook-associated protein FlgL [Jatrophihabitans sp.]|jgi:flagellar hook-associated protein 3 FlgL
MRVTEGSAVYSSLAGLQSTASRLAALQSQLSSGRQITKPSDSPTGTSQALGLRAELTRVDQYGNNATDAIGWMTTTDSTLSSAVTQLQSVRSLVLQGLNTAMGTPTSNNALAQQVDQLRASMLSLSNATYQGRPIFGGTTAGAVAFDSTGNYVGDTGTVTRTVGPSTTVDINNSGTDVFGPDGGNVFSVLSDISAKLRSDPSTLTSSLQDLDTAMTRMSSQQALSGAVYQRVQVAQTVNATNTLQLKSQLSNLQDIDLASMAVQVSTADAAYQASLATTAKIRQTSLLDYLR